MPYPSAQDQIPTLDDAYFVGQGFDIYGSYNSSSFTKPLFDYINAPTHIITIDGKSWHVPVFVLHLPGNKTEYASEAGVSREEFQRSLSTTAKVSVSYGAFSGHMESSFSHQVAQSSEYMFAHNTMYTWAGSLQLQPDTQYLNTYFSDAIKKLPSEVTPNNLYLFTEFFAAFGVYYTRQVRLGGSLEFYVAVSTTSIDDSQQVKVMLEAHYNGLFSKGSIDASLEKSARWQSYISTSIVNMNLVGGSIDTQAELAGINLKQPSSDTVAAYNAWVKTIGENLNPINFQLAPIWELCGEKSAVVHQAWDKFYPTMHPEMYIETTSPQTRPVLALLTEKGDITPTTPPEYPFGCMVAILDRVNLLKANSVKFERYYSVNPKSWPLTYKDMYNTIASDIRASGFYDSNHLLVFVTMGLDVNCIPLENLYSLLMSAGAGQFLTKWTNVSTPGQHSDVKVNYILVGPFNQGKGQGFEGFYYGVPPQNFPLDTTLNLYFYSPSIAGGRYSIGLNPFPSLLAKTPEAKS